MAREKDEEVEDSDDDEDGEDYEPHSDSERSDDHVIDENVESEQIAIQEQQSSENVVHPGGFSEAHEDEEDVEMVIASRSRSRDHSAVKNSQIIQS